MDKSSKYIKMCQEAEEIQKQAPDENVEGCFFYNPFTDEVMCRDGWNYCIVEDLDIELYECPTQDWHEDKNIIWLPRLDQLVEMLGGYKELKKQKHINNLCMMKNDFNSLEQLFLAYIMKQKYGKIWNGQRWEKIQERTRCAN